MSTVAFPVNAVPGFTVLGSQFGLPGSYDLYKVNTVTPERIEAVTMTLDYGTLDDAISDVYVLQLVDQSGVLIDQQATPAIVRADGSLIVYLCWSRLGNDSGLETATPVLFDVDNTYRLWLNMRLPEAVLQPRSTVRLLAWKEDGGEAPGIVVSDATVTTTPNAGAVASTTLANVLPLLTPTDQG